MAQTLITFDPADLIQVELTHDFDKLSRVLNRITNSLFSTSRQVHAVAEDVTALRHEIKENNELIAMLKNEIQSNFSIFSSDLKALWDNFKILSASTVEKERYESHGEALEEKINGLTQKVAVLEAVGGAHAETYIRKYVTDFYALHAKTAQDTERDYVQECMFEQRNSMVNSFREEISLMQSNLLKESTKRSTEVLGELSLLNEEKKKDVALLYQRLDQAKQRATTQLEEMAGALRSELLCCEKNLADRLDATGGRVSDLYKIFIIDEAKVHEILTEGFFDEDDFDMQQDARVEMIMNAPAFVLLRREADATIEDRLRITTKGMQDDFQKEFHCIQKDVAKKANSKHVQEMIDALKEASLEKDVQDLKQKVLSLNSNKVSVEMFSDAMKSKVDQRMLDAKVEKEYLTSLFDYLAARIEETNEAMSVLRVETKIHRQIVSEAGGGKANESPPKAVEKFKKVVTDINPGGYGSQLHNRNVASAQPMRSDPRDVKVFHQPQNPPLIPNSPATREAFEWSVEGGINKPSRPHTVRPPRKFSAGGVVEREQVVEQEPVVVPVASTAGQIAYYSALKVSFKDGRSEDVPSTPENPLQSLVKKVITSSMQEDRKIVNDGTLVIPYVPRARPSPKE